MNITFLVGNGFDISAGLKTSYNDFLKWYCAPSDTPDSYVIKQLKDTIKNDNDNSWSDLEIALGKYTANFSHANEKSFIECYEDLHDKIIEFIILSEGKYDFGLITKKALNSISSGLCNFYQELTPSERIIFDELIQKDKAFHSEISFISFNYTRLLDSYIEALSNNNNNILKAWNYKGGHRYLKLNSTVLHIHGTTDCFPVFGVGDTQDIANQDLLKNPAISDSLVKRNHVDYIGELWYDEAEKIINNSKIICIFGMSLGQSDSPWWRKIMSWMSQNQICHLIIFWYSSEANDSISVIKRRNVKEPIKEKLLSYCPPNTEDLNDISDRIHVVFNSKKMLLVPSVNIDL